MRPAGLPVPSMKSTNIKIIFLTLNKRILSYALDSLYSYSDTEFVIEIDNDILISFEKHLPNSSSKASNILHKLLLFTAACLVSSIVRDLNNTVDIEYYSRRASGDIV